MNTKKKILSVLAIVLGLAMIASLAFGLTACGDDEGNVLTAPTDFTFDIETGDFTFTDNDENAGYYYVRCYAVINGVEATTYTVTSSRINGGNPGPKSGTVDIDGFAWGEYNLKLVTYAATKSDYVAPDPVVIKAEFGVGGIMETPQILAMYSGNTVELVIDYSTLTNYYLYQTMPTVRFDFYSDQALTTLAWSTTVDTSLLLDTLDKYPNSPTYIWGYSASALFKPLNSGSTGYAYNAYDYTTDDLKAGTYYVAPTAISPASFISDSNQGEAVMIVLTDEEATATFTSSAWSGWTDPSGSAPGAGEDSTRENFGGSQTVTNRIATSA